MMFEVLAFMKEKDGYCQLDDEHERGKTCEKSQHQEQAAEDLREEDQDE